MKLTKSCLKLFFLTLIVFLNLSLVRTASAITITDTEWHELTWSQGNTILNRFNREGAFTFNVLTGGSATLQVTDIGFNFERYEVFNFGIWNGLWTTSPKGSLVNTLFTSSLVLST